MKSCRGESYNHNGFTKRIINGIPDKLLVSSQSDTRQPAHKMFYTL